MALIRLTQQVYSSNDEKAPALELDLRPYRKGEHKQDMNVFLCLPNDTNTQTKGGASRFYSVDGPEIADEILPESKVTIPRLYPNLTLAAGDVPPPNHTSFVISKIQCDDSFGFAPFIAPCLFLNTDTFLWHKCQTIAHQLREKAHYLSGIWQNQMGSPMMRETELLLRPLITALPSLESLLNTAHVSPYALFQEMLKVAGALAPLRYSQIPPLLMGYTHNDIYDSFEPVLDLIGNYIDTIEQSYSIFPFSQKERLFYLRLNGNQIQSKLYIGLRIPKGATESMMEEWMMDAVIASDFSVEMVRNRRITGARRVRIDETLENEMMPNRGVIVFEVSFDPDFIALDQNLNIFNSNDTIDKRPTELILHVRKAGVLEVETLYGYAA